LLTVKYDLIPTKKVFVPGNGLTVPGAKKVKPESPEGG
jgi:hypothetical protein